MNRTCIAAVILTMALASPSLHAHDFWLAAAPAATGATSLSTSITGHIGETFPRADTKTTPDRVDSWQVVGPGGRIAHDDVFEQVEDALGTTVSLPEAGTYLGMMTILPREIEMSGKDFTDYLKEEGLTAIIAARARAGKAATPARERYARYAKIVLDAGGMERRPMHLWRPTGMKAEFVPLRNPAQVTAGSQFAVRLLVAGRAVPGANVTALSAHGRLDVTTDEDGVATFTLPAEGAWLIRTVHMEPAGPNAGVDWESYWVTLSFSTRGVQH